MSVAPAQVAIKHTLGLLTALTTCFIASAAHAKEADGEKIPVDDKGIFSVVWENDITSGQDSNYTNGVRFAWLSSERQVPQWSKDFANAVMPFSKDGEKRISFAVGQSMFTPKDLETKTLQVNDRPYAGWSYGTFGIISDTGETLDNMMLTVGVVGPDSYAEQTQHMVHQAVDAQKAMGWDNQLKNEIGVNLGYERKWRSLYQAEPFGLGADVTPHVGLNLGNVNTDASVGAIMRLGYDLPADYGPPRIRPSLPGSDFFIPTQKLSGYLFAGVEGRGVAHNIFLDGNTFRDSHSVDKENWVGSFQLGATVIYKAMRISYEQVFMTKEFKTQIDPAQFSALTVSWRF